IWLSFAVMDWVVAPELAPQFLVYRLASVSVVGALLLLSRSGLPTSVHEVVSPLFPATVSVAASVMTCELGGFSSTYYVGIIVIMLYGGVLMPWRVGQAVALVLACIGPYVFINGSHYGFDGAAEPLAFLLGSGVITVLAVQTSRASRHTNFKLREKEKLSREAAEEANAAKTRFLAQVGHELRTPLMLIRGPLEAMVESGTVDADATRIMFANIDLLTRHLNTLLDVSRADDGELRLKVSRGNLGEVAETVAELARPHAEQRGITLLKKISKGLPESEFDPLHVEMILGNLISNAIKFTPNGGTVIVTASEEKEGLLLSVQDTGVGIPAGELEKVFGRFYRVTSAETSGVGGTGLGLSLVKHLVEMHGGTVKVSSGVGVGSLFTTVFPRTPPIDPSTFERRRGERRRQARRREDRQPLLSASDFDAHRFILADLGQIQYGEEVSAVSEQPGPNAPTILVVEDNNELRRSIAGWLSGEFRVLTATDGLDGYRKAVEAKPDVILSDIMMGQHDGYELLRLLRRETTSAETRIVMLTARAGADDAVATLEAKADDYLRKPFSVNELRARIRNQLRLRDAEKTLGERETRLLAIGSMASAIVHDIRNSISSVVATASLASYLHEQNTKTLKGDDAEKGQQISRELVAIEDRSMRAVGMLQEILDYSRGAEVRLKLESIKIRDLVSRVVAGVKPSLDYSDIDLVVTCDCEEEDVILDIERLFRALENLVFNARDAVMLAKNEIRVVELQFHLDRDHLCIVVADSGTGIEDTRQIFDAFVSDKENGTGIGLATVRNVVKSHGGDVQVVGRGRLGGAQFTVLIPVEPGGTLKEQVPPTLAH
ncbi:MAG: ATP-binding protein, partial [Myxococcota bacterium]